MSPHQTAADHRTLPSIFMALDMGNVRTLQTKLKLLFDPRWAPPPSSTSLFTGGRLVTSDLRRVAEYTALSPIPAVGSLQAALRCSRGRMGGRRPSFNAFNHPGRFPRRSGRSFSGWRRSLMARPVDADPILAYPDAIHVFGKHNMDLAFMAEGAGLGCNTIVVAPSDAGACPRPAGSKTVRVIFKRYGCRRAVTADFGHLGLCREACAALGRAGRSVPRERQNGERKTRARTHRFSPSCQGFGREWDGRGLHREVKAGLAWRSRAQAAARRRAGAGGDGTDHRQDSEASSLFLPSKFFC